MGFHSELLSVTWYNKSKNVCFDGETGKDLTERIHSLLAKQDKGLEAAKSRQADQEKRAQSLLTDASRASKIQTTRETL